MRTAWQAWGPAAVWAAVLFFLSELSALPAGLDVPLLDKAVHFILYAVLGASLGWGRRVVGPAAPHWVLLSLGWAYGAADEWHQHFVPGRTPEPADFLADLAGVTLGYAGVLLFARRASRIQTLDRDEGSGR